MMKDSVSLRGDLVEAFLVRRGWVRDKTGARLVQYRAPADLNAGEQFLLSLPARDSEDAQIVLRRAASTLARIYGLSEANAEDLFSAPGIVLSIQLRDSDTRRGSVTLPRFETFVEKVKKTLLDVAAFVVTERPTIREGVADAERFVQRCRFLQTEYGSYVAKIHLPTDGSLVQPSLFDAEVPTAAVSERLADMLSFVVGPVFRKDPEILTEDFFLESRDLLNVDVLTDIGELFGKVATEEMNFVFSGVSGERAIKSGRITDVEQARVASFIDYLRERVNDVVPLDAVGRIVKLHSRNPMQHRNYIAIASSFEGHPVTIGVTLRSGDYAIAVMAHRQNQPVHIRGRAQRLKTQFSITELDLLEPVGPLASPSGESV